MQKTILNLFLVLFSYFSYGQSANKIDFNFGFEKNSHKNQFPDNWERRGLTNYTLKIDSVEKHSGSASMLIEHLGNQADQSFGCVTLSIPAIYEGSQIEVRAYMKLQNVANGSIGLLLRIDGDGDVLKFSNMHEENIHGTSDWTLYSIKLALPSDSKKISIGALLTGTGKLWVDDFQLLIDGEDIRKAKPKLLQLFNAESDTTFDNGSNISNIDLTPSKIENLALLCEIWGFLKYYHPAVAKGNYNWDYELFRILPKIIQCENEKDRNEIILKWISKIGDIGNDTLFSNDNSQIKFHPDFSWILDSIKLGNELSHKLLQIEDFEHNNKHYYVKFLGKNPEFTNEKPYYSNLPDVGFRLLALYRYWNIIQYFFPYKHLIEENWNSVLTEFIPRFISATSELSYKLTILSLLAKIHDGHANIWKKDDIIEKYIGLNYAPVELRFIENKLTVTEYLHFSLGPNSGLKKGDIITQINNKSINEIIKERLPFTPASNYSRQLHDIASNILRTNDSIIDVTFERNNISQSLKIECFSPKNFVFENDRVRNDSCLKFLTPDIAYINPGSIYFNLKVITQVLKTKGLILDMRCYPSQFIVFSFGEYLMPDSIDFVKFTKTDIHNPGLFYFVKGQKVGKNNKDYYKGKIVILVNERTFSQAEYTTMAFRVAPNAIVVGSSTSGADGNVSKFYLPGGIETMISGIGVYYPDGRETQRIGIVPDIEVKPTLNGVINGKDEILGKAIEILNKKK